MKKIILTFVVVMMGLWSFPSFSQVENEVVALGLPGDNLNLYAVLDIFQNSQTLEEFERKLNSRDTNVNNLDLNNDNMVDYISVVSYNQGHFYSIVLRVPINSSQYQDVAVIEVSKNNAGNVIVQIIGDEALYGRDYVVEPSVRVVSETPNPGYVGDRTIIINNRVYGNGIVYVADWPIIAFLFSPSFSVYVSPWHWGYYPVYWNPWRPVLYFNYWTYHRHYYNSPRYHRTSYIRFPSHHSYYLNRRATSSIVTRNRSAGTYRSTYGGRNFRQPAAPPRVSRRDIRRENRESPQQRPFNRQETRQRVQPVIPGSRIPTRRQERQSTGEENRQSTRQQVQPSTVPRNRPSPRHENRRAARQQVQPSAVPQNRTIRQENRQEVRREARPSTAPQNRPIRQENRRAARQQAQPSAVPQNRQSTRLENRQSTRQQARPANSQAPPSSTRQTDRQIRQEARQTARETRQSNRAERQKTRP
ncbi:MAG TPA: hypothetical protein VIH09_01270 [Flavobacterium sp.]|uniref:hypothetical protein n=1 Tax=Flavobacterium sp. TaxID=239 RepID=UPI002F42537B